MGLKEIERWINILMIKDMGESKPEELVNISLIRTKFAESVAMQGKFKNMRHEAALMGLFSTLDAVLDTSMEEALKDIAIPDSIKDALIYGKGVLSNIYELVIAYEKGIWEKVISFSEKINVSANVLFEEYLSAIKWAKEALQIMA